MTIIIGKLYMQRVKYNVATNNKIYHRMPQLSADRAETKEGWGDTLNSVRVTPNQEPLLTRVCAS